MTHALEQREAIARALFQRFKERAASRLPEPQPGSYALDHWENLPLSFKRDFYLDADAILALTPSPCIERAVVDRAVEHGRSCLSTISSDTKHVQIERAALRTLLSYATETNAYPAAARQIEILRRALAWHGDALRMATTREEWQQEIDAALVWVRQNPEEGYPSFPSFTAREYLPEALPGHWATAEGRDMALRSLDDPNIAPSRARVPDLALANAVFLTPHIANLTDAKERIRWLSAMLAVATGFSPIPEGPR
ncbi:hypothetical protein K9B35_14445 [Sphingomonas sp. R647]|uniref:hypothetical protein n=1 Tax=Sphingomonas sp. R647 TaxID=2875233 RepID=UPI001CD80645|nr:hypothetical protein [Sphingomonas sp. R647]MCA1199174.1 hypothetical protein [Sphingomonas sp. R647]